MDITHEVAWAAGFFDGEGHVRHERGTNFTIAIPQTDRRVLDRFRVAVRGLGRIYGPSPAKGNRRSQWRYQVAGHPRVQAVCAMLWPWLSPVKREQFRVALTGTVLRPHLREHGPCPHGRRRSKVCSDCRHAYYRDWYAKPESKVKHLAQSRRQRQRPEYQQRERERNRRYMQRRRLIRKTAAALLVAS